MEPCRREAKTTRGCAVSLPTPHPILNPHAHPDGTYQVSTASDACRVGYDSKAAGPHSPFPSPRSLPDCQKGSEEPEHSNRSKAGEPPITPFLSPSLPRQVNKGPSWGCSHDAGHGELILSFQFLSLVLVPSALFS